MNRTTFRDLLMIMLLGFVFIIIAMVPHLNPPATEDQTEPPGNVIAHIVWPEGNTDVDLWVYGPGERRPVGYAHKSGLLWNLLRDDLGTSPDATSLNYENAYTRGIIPGEYIINVHCYRCPVFPVPVEVEISVKNETGDKSGMKIIATTKATLYSNGEEITAIRFKLTESGDLVPESVNNLHKPLRAAGGGGAGGYSSHPGGDR